MATDESKLVTRIHHAITVRWPSVWFFKVVGHPYQMGGVPDILLCIDGKLVALEVKHQKPGESEEHARMRATPLQLIQIREIREAGGVAEVVISVAEALRVVESALKPAEQEKERDADKGTDDLG